MPRPAFLGSATRYERRQLLWLVAARRLRTTERLELAQVRTRLNAFTAAELEAYATTDVPPGPLADALGVRPAPPTTVAGARGFTIVTPVNSVPNQRWTRLELAVGLELHVRDDISLRNYDLGKRVWQWCAEPSPGGGSCREASRGDLKSQKRFGRTARTGASEVSDELPASMCAAPESVSRQEIALTISFSQGRLTVDADERALAR